jgi:hypothetical protein
MDWLGAPDQGAVTSPLRPLGRNGEEIELTEEAMEINPQPSLINGEITYIVYKTPAGLTAMAGIAGASYEHVMCASHAGTEFRSVRRAGLTKPWMTGSHGSIKTGR